MRKEQRKETNGKERRENKWDIVWGGVCWERKKKEGENK